MKKYPLEIVVGIFVIVGLCLVGYMTVKLGHVSLGQKTYPLYAPFTTVSGLRVGSQVEMLGLEVGRVEKLTLNQKDEMVVVRMQIQNGIEIYGDAIASIKTEGLIGDKYLSISPGGAAPLLKPGETIIATQPAVNIIDLIGKYAFGEVKGEKGETPKESEK